jgi:hypothetical protein
VSPGDSISSRCEHSIRLFCGPQFSNWRLWIHFLITLTNNGPQRAFDTYSPSIVNSFGFANLASNALASVGLFLQIPVSFCFSYVSDRM